VSSAAWGFLAALASSGVLVALLAPPYVRRAAAAKALHDRAQAAAVLNETALELVQPLRDELKELRGELKVYQERVRSLERQEREHAQLLAGHAAWDLLAAQSSQQLPPAPPLFPPRRDERTRATDA